MPPWEAGLRLPNHSDATRVTGNARARAQRGFAGNWDRGWKFRERAGGSCPRAGHDRNGVAVRAMGDVARVVVLLAVRHLSVSEH